MPTKSPTSTCQVADSNLAFTRWTTKPQRMSKTSSKPNTLLSNTLLRTSIAPTPPNRIFAQESLHCRYRQPTKIFPIANWCRLTNQCNYTINMLCPCCQNPLLSSFEAMEGSYSFDAPPMAPPCTKVLVHLEPTCCKSWSFHASNGWYIGPSLKHYRCIRAIMDGTGGKRLANIFCFKHQAMAVPIITPTNQIIAAI